MRLGGKVHDRVGAVAKSIADHRSLADVSVNEGVASVAFDVGKVGPIPRIRQGIEIDDLRARPLAQNQAYERRPNKPKAARHENTR